MGYFITIFSTVGCCDYGVFQLLQRKVTPYQNTQKLRLFDVHEVKDALFAIFHDKFLGSDGMNPSFYQHLMCWVMILWLLLSSVWEIISFW